MQQVRTATEADKVQIRALWAARFGDSDAFMDWFFRERFYPSLSSCLEEDGRILSALQSCHVRISIRGHILPASLLAGVSTDAAEEGKGYMRRIMLHYMRRVHSAGIPVSVCTPAYPGLYASRGYCPATDTLHLKFDAASAPALPEGVQEWSLCDDPAPLHACYQQALSGYSGVISRSPADFCKKLCDYASDGAHCYVLQEGETALGYCVYFTEPTGIHAEEVVALDEAAYRTLLQALRFAAQGKSLHAKLPPMPAFRDACAQAEIRPQGVMAATDIGKLLMAVLGNASLRFLVRDASIPENAGVWNGAGQPICGVPQLEIEAGRLGQLLCGYASAEELAAGGYLTVYDRGAMRTLCAALPKVPCFIVDEY